MSKNDSSGTYTDMSIMDFDDDDIVMVKADVINNSIDRLMFILGQRGFGVTVRYDPFREKNNFTVIVGNQRIGDTDDPRELLRSLLESESE
jgi:hypothetical protein